MLAWLKGIIPPLATPFDDEGRIETRALRDEVEYQLSCGAKGICVGGSTGEGAGFTAEEVFELCSISVEHMRGRAPVIGGLIPDTTAEAIQLGLAAKKAGVNALQVTPPHYLFPPDADQLVSYYLRIRRETSLPIILYNVLPWFQIDADGVGKLVEAGAIDAVKQSGANLHLVADLLYRFGEKIPIMTAVDDLILPSFVLGAAGAIAAIVTVLPKESVELYDAVQKGDLTRAVELHQKLLVVWRALEGGAGFPGRVKYAIDLQGRHAGLPRHPQRIANEADREIVQKAFHEAQIAIPSIV